MSIDEKIKGIRPYILQIRYQGELSIVDVKLKESWKVPKTQENLVGVQEYDQYPGTYMFYSDNDKIGIDDIVDYVGEIVKINIEREKKLELLSIKKNELTNFFTKHTFEELGRMKFVIEKEDSVESELHDLPLPTPKKEEETTSEVEVEVEEITTKEDIKEEQ
jgi:hypothetical protein